MGTDIDCSYTLVALSCYFLSRQLPKFFSFMAQKSFIHSRSWLKVCKHSETLHWIFFSDSSLQILKQEYILPDINVHLKDNSVFVFYPQDQKPLHTVVVNSVLKVPDVSIFALVSLRSEAAATGTQTTLHACPTSRTFLTAALWWNLHSAGFWASPPRSYAGTLESGSALV